MFFLVPPSKSESWAYFANGTSYPIRKRDKRSLCTVQYTCSAGYSTGEPLEVGLMPHFFPNLRHPKSRSCKSFFLWSGNQEPHRRIAIARRRILKGESDQRQLEKRILETLPAQQSEHSVYLIRFFVLQSIQSSNSIKHNNAILRY